MPVKTNLIPLQKAVASAIVDSYEDVGRTESMYFHWAAREIKLLSRGTIKNNPIRRVMLHINSNTNTATLPCDFTSEVFVGTVVDGRKIAFTKDNSIVSDAAIDYDEKLDKCCKQCGQPKGICDDLQLSETTTMVDVNGVIYPQVEAKHLYANGDYYLETLKPIFDTETETVNNVLFKEFITKIERKDCGCPSDTPDNINKIRSISEDVYGCYYTTCSCTENVGAYNILEETGLIQFSPNFGYNKVYLEYKGFLPKKDGQYLVPEVAFEAVVEGIKYRSIKNRKNEPQWRIREYKDNALAAKRNMIRELGQVSLGYILEVATRIPSFDISKKH